MENRNINPLILRIRKLLSSVGLTVVLLFGLAGVSIIGTLIQQNLPPIEYTQRYGFKLYSFFNLLGFFDIYHVWWFVGIIVLLAVNLTFCTLERLPGVFKRLKQGEPLVDESRFKNLPFYREIVIDKGVKAFPDRLDRLLRSLGGKFTVNPDSKGKNYVWEKGRVSILGPYITHAGIIIILIGALIGNLAGFRANVRIVEGEKANVVYDVSRAKEIPLDFEVKCEDFSVDFYPGTERPKRFASDLKVIEDGKVVAGKVIEVNSPLKYKGLTFYQSDYGPAAPPSFEIMVHNIKTEKDMDVVLNLEQEQEIQNGVTIKVIDYAQNYMGFGPAVLVELNEDSQGSSRFPVFQNVKDFDAHSGKAYRVKLTKIIEPSLYFTGLQVTRDPGVNVVWLGSFIMSIGLTLAFFLYHRMILLRVKEDNGKIVVLAGGRSFKNKIGFEREFMKVIERIKAAEGKL
ncbi:MAG TPA: cytochrome c biogenesis protein ResB [bacterium]